VIWIFWLLWIPFVIAAGFFVGWFIGDLGRHFFPRSGTAQFLFFIGCVIVWVGLIHMTTGLLFGGM
jgi:hypothetical protein